MNVTAAEPSRRTIPRADFGRVTVFFGEKNGKYPDANQVIVRGSDTQAAFDTPIVANHIGSEFDRSDIVILGHVHEDHMAALHRLPKAPVHVHEADLAAAQSWEGLRAAYGSDESYVAEMLSRFQRDFFYAPRPDAIGYRDGAVWELGGSRVRAFHMPGHTAGHCVLLVEPEGVAFIGDIDLTGFGAHLAKVQAEQQTLAARSKDDIIKALHERGETFAAFLEGLTDATLAERVSIPVPGNPHSKTRFEMLLSPKEHEMHHRGQLMLVERIIGIVPHLTKQREAMAAQMQGQAAATR